MDTADTDAARVEQFCVDTGDTGAAYTCVCLVLLTNIRWIVAAVILLPVLRAVLHHEPAY